MVDGAPARPLGRHVLERAHEHPCLCAALARQRLARVDEVAEGRDHELGQAEIEDLQQPVRRDHQVLGLEVAMDDPGAMRLGQTVRELGAQVEHFAEGQGTRPEPPPQRLPLDALHDDVVRPGHVGGRAHVVDVHDVRMIEGGGRACLAVEPLQELRVRAGAQDLDGDGPAEPGVTGAIDLAHASRTEAVDDLVGADAGPGSEGVLHGVGSVGGHVRSAARPDLAAAYHAAAKGLRG
jgi:hypothetical protein